MKINQNLVIYLYLIISLFILIFVAMSKFNIGNIYENGKVVSEDKIEYVDEKLELNDSIDLYVYEKEVLLVDVDQHESIDEVESFNVFDHKLIINDYVSFINDIQKYKIRHPKVDLNNLFIEISLENRNLIENIVKETIMIMNETKSKDVDIELDSQIDNSIIDSNVKNPILIEKKSKPIKIDIKEAPKAIPSPVVKLKSNNQSNVNSTVNRDVGIKSKTLKDLIVDEMINANISNENQIITSDEIKIFVNLIIDRINIYSLDKYKQIYFQDKIQYIDRIENDVLLLYLAEDATFNNHNYSSINKLNDFIIETINFVYARGLDVRIMPF